MAKIKDSKKIISRYFAFYFLGRFEAKFSAMIMAFVLNTVFLLGTLIVNKLFAVELSFANILFPITYMGVIGVFKVNKLLKNNINRGLYATERTISDTKAINKSYEAGKIDVLLSFVSLFAGIIQLVFVKSILEGILIGLLIGLNIFNLYVNGIYEEINKIKKTVLLAILSFFTLAIAIVLRISDITALIPSKIVILLAIVFAGIGYMKAKSLLNFLFYYKKTHFYVKSYENYENLDVSAEDLKEEEVKTVKYDRTSQALRALERGKKEEQEFLELAAEKYKKHLAKEATNKIPAKYKKENSGYFAENATEGSDSRFLAKNKR